MSMSSAILGIDIAKLKFDAVLRLRSGQIKHRVFKNNLAGFVQLAQWLEREGIEHVHACLEATGRYGEALAHFLHAAGHEVSIVNPLRIKRYADSQLRRVKTDKSDATLIADFCFSQPVRLWQPPAPAWRELQALVRDLDSLQIFYHQEANRLKAQPPSATVQTRLEQHLAFLKAQIAALKRAIQTFIRQHPFLKQQFDLLTSIVGIGALTAAPLLAEIPDIHQFQNARQLAAYAGTTPGFCQSGSSVYRPGHLVKTANARLRNALYFPAITAKRFNPLIRAFCQRLLASGKPPKLVVAAAMRKLLHLIFGVLKHQQPFDPLYLEFAP
jgi:transposase